MELPLFFMAQSAAAVEYTDWISVEGKTPPMNVLLWH